MTFYPKHLPIPWGSVTADFRIRPLRAADNELDHAAVMASAEQLRIGTLGAWPREDFTLAENLADLVQHEADHGDRTSFTFTIMHVVEAECLGCIYINPIQELLGRVAPSATLMSLSAPAATVDFWMRPICRQAALDKQLLHMLRVWFTYEWQFASVVFPVTEREVRQQQIAQDAGLQIIDTEQTQHSHVSVFSLLKMPGLS